MRGKIALLLVIVLLLTSLLRRRRWNLAELLVFLFALYSGFTYIRFLFLLAIVAAPVLAKSLDFFPPYRPELETPIVNTLVVCIMATAMVAYWPRTAELQKSIEQEYPTKALPVLKAHPLTGPMLNFYLWGGYLGWNNNDVKVFVDSRVDIFEYAGVLKDYLDLLGVRDAPAILDKYGIQYVLFPNSEPVIYVLKESPAWKVLYSDELCVLLERAPANASSEATPAH